jgi:mannonate dehydratase
MLVGTRISPEWLERPDDLRFLKQVGVDVVDITMSLIPGYSDTGRLSREGLERAVDLLAVADLRIERINSTGDATQRTFLGQDGAEEELDNLAHNAQMCIDYGLPVLGVQCFQASTFGHFPDPGYSWVEGRGGYQYLRSDLRDAIKTRPAPEGSPTHEELWERTVRIFQTIMPVAESGGLLCAMHGNDPPVPALYGVAQILYDFDSFDRLFREVDSPSMGMTFCVGTRYESGQDVFEGIRRFGSQGKIFHVHFRNVHGRIPVDGWYEERAPDEGDLSMCAVAGALRDVGYQRAIDYDHIMKLVGDDDGKAYIAFCVGHSKGILEGLQTA